MKKFILKLSFCIVICTCIVIFLNVNITSQQGINYQVHTIRMPLYLKILDFFDRHFNYKQLVKEIIKEATTDKERVMKIFTWTCDNIKKAPKGLPIMDDHVWYTIVRGYGVRDQFSDIFTTLSNYANLEAFYAKLYNREDASQIILSFIKVNNKWCIFDPYTGVYFENKEGSFASIEDIATGNWAEKNIGDFDRPQTIYADYFGDISTINLEETQRFSRANIQSPIKRFIYGIKKGKL